VASSADGVVFVRHRRARRYILRVLPDGTLRVTLPRWGVKREAQAFVDASRAWIARQRARPPVASPEPWADGTCILLDGHPTPLVLERDGERTRLWCGDALVTTRRGAAIDVPAEVKGWLRARARRELPAVLHALAGRHGITVPRVSIRDQRSRWGACSPTGTITLNWRLLQAPMFVREYVLLHELMHRRELNHSRRFWRLVAACCPRHAEARQWLRREGKSLWADCE
jgi:predicted metal-dependent hydrolase